MMRVAPVGCNASLGGRVEQNKPRQGGQETQLGGGDPRNVPPSLRRVSLWIEHIEVQPERREREEWWLAAILTAALECTLEAEH